MSLSQTLDFSEFDARYSRAQRREFVAWAKGTHEGSLRWRDLSRTLLVGFFVGAAILVVVLFAAGILLGTVASFARPEGVLGGLIVVVFVAVILARLTDIWRRDVRPSIGWRRWMRMDRFALANARSFEPQSISPAYEGSVFTIGAERRAHDIVATTGGRYVEVGNYQFRGESGLNRSLNRCGYVRVELDREVPHLYLRTRRSRKFGATFARAQEFSLEGDFGRHFRLYAPSGYERDALYILTPDVMAVLIDEAAEYDVEFVGSHIYFYTPRRFDMRAPSTYSRTGRLVDTVVARVQKQTAAYSDFRTSGRFITEQGARLNRGVTVAMVVGAVYACAQLVRLIVLATT